MFWLIVYFSMRDGLLDLLMWSIRAIVLFAGYFTVRTIVRRARHTNAPPALTPEAVRLIRQICHPFARPDLYEHGGIWTRADYDAWVSAQTDAWLIISNRISTCEEITHEHTQPTPSLDHPLQQD